MPRPTRWRGWLAPGAGLMSFSFMLALKPDEVGDALDHAAHRGRVLQLDDVVQPAQAEPAHGRDVALLAARRALDQLHLDLLVGHGYSLARISSTFLPRLAAISAGVFIACSPCSVARTTL